MVTGLKQLGNSSYAIEMFKGLLTRIGKKTKEASLIGRTSKGNLIFRFGDSPISSQKAYYAVNEAELMSGQLNGKYIERYSGLFPWTEQFQGSGYRVENLKSDYDGIGRIFSLDRKTGNYTVKMYEDVKHGYTFPSPTASVTLNSKNQLVSGIYRDIDVIVREPGCAPYVHKRPNVVPSDSTVYPNVTKALEEGIKKYC